MQKNNFFALIALFVTSSLISMESTPNNDISKFIVSLHLQERKSKYILDPTTKRLNDPDCYACTVLGIPWKENNNKYITNFAFIRKAEDPKLDFKSQTLNNCWHRNFIEILPLTKEPNPHLSKPFHHYIKFPETFPATFVERLEKEGSLTVTTDHFVKPIEIVFELDSLSKLTQKFVVALDLDEVKKEALQDNWNKQYDEEDKHACKVLGITWEENNNTYFTNNAGIRKCNETTYNDWKQYIYGFPKAAIRNENEE